ncbi:MAG: flagellar basal-body rod protein FlgF [Deltaproteobacteria bacterium]
MGTIAGLHPHARLGHMEALEGAIINERKLELVANEMANVSTVGFKRQRITFEEYLLPQQDQTLRNAKGERVATDFSQGPVHQTGNPFDFAIEGEGFFVVETPQGKRYTRAGNFTLDAEQRLVTQEGYPVLGDGAPIVIEDTTGDGVWLSEDGRFFVDGTQQGRIDVVRFENPQGLGREGRNLYVETDASGPGEQMDGRVIQGAIEGANVNAVEAMVHLIDLYRSYEAQQKTLQAVDQLDEKASTTLGRVG